MPTLQEKEEQDKKYNPAEQRFGGHDDLNTHPERREAEVDDLEKLYDAESRSDSDRNTQKKDTNTETEKTALSEKSGETGPDASWKTNVGKNGSVLQLFGPIPRRNAIIGGGVVGGLLGTVMAFYSLVSGPLQFIHMAQLLQQFHFSDQEEAGNDRLSKLVRFARSAGDIKQTRVSTVGSKILASTETKLSNNGIELLTSDRLAFFDGYAVDPAKYAEANGIDSDSVKEDFKSKTGIDLEFDVDSGKYLASASNKYLADRKMTAKVLRAIGYNRVGSAIRTRTITKATAVVWHPMKKLDNKLLESVDARFAAWSEERESRIKNGSQDPNTNNIRGDPETGEVDENGNKTPRADVGEAGEVADELTPGKAAGTPSERIGAVRGNTAFKAGAGAVGVIGLTCAAQAVAENVDKVKQTNIVLPLIRLGMESITLGNQVMSNQDVDLTQLGFYSKQFTDELGHSWIGGRSIQAEQGQELTGPDIPSEARIDPNGNPVAQFFNKIPALSGVCGFVNTGIGQVISFGVDVVAGGPVSALGGQAVSAILGPKLFESLTNWLSGEVLDVKDVSGPDFGNYINYGGRHASNASYMAAGGTELSRDEEARLRNLHQTIAKGDMAEKSFAYRMFGLSDPNTLASRFIDRQNPNVEQNVSNIATSITGSIFTIGKQFGSIITPRGFAADSESYDYGFRKYGFSVSDLENQDTKNPYVNASEASKILEGPGGTKYIERAKSCFGVNLSTDGKTTPPDQIPEYSGLPAECTNDKSTEWLRIRFMIFDTQTAEATACYGGEAESCNAIGFGQTGPAANNNPSTPVLNGVECPANMTETKQVGGSTYYKLPDAPGGEYTIYSKDARRYGQRELVCVLYTVAKAYKSMYGEKSTMSIGDLNAAGHKSHKWGVAVDLDAQGEVVAADNVNAPSKYSTEATIALGKLFVDTGYIKNIWYCSNDGAIEAIKGYATSVGKPINMKCLPNHYNHFHVDINTPHGAVDMP